MGLNLPVIIWKLHHNPSIRDDIKSYGKFAIFTRLKIGGGLVERAHIGKIRTKDRNFHARVFGKIGLKIGGCLEVYL